VLRLALEPLAGGVRVTLLKARGAVRAAVDLAAPGLEPA
jgi:hypothetical protein